jgi:hypothetical protein
MQFDGGDLQQMQVSHGATESKTSDYREKSFRLLFLGGVE